MVEFPRLREVDPGDYGWSSHGAHAHGKADPLSTDHEKYLALGKTPGERQHAYRELFRSHLDPNAIHGIREALNQSQVLGSERFKDEIEHQLQRRVCPGRPKNDLRNAAH